MPVGARDHSTALPSALGQRVDLMCRLVSDPIQRVYLESVGLILGLLARCALYRTLLPSFEVARTHQDRTSTAARVDGHLSPEAIRHGQRPGVDAAAYPNEAACLGVVGE